MHPSDQSAAVVGLQNFGAHVGQCNPNWIRSNLAESTAFQKWSLERHGTSKREEYSSMVEGIFGRHVSIDDISMPQKQNGHDQGGHWHTVNEIQAGGWHHCVVQAPCHQPGRGFSAVFGVFSLIVLVSALMNICSSEFVWT
jgi:hypothetical protein